MSSTGPIWIDPHYQKPQPLQWQTCKCGPCPLHVNRNADYIGIEFWNTPPYQPKHRKPGPAQTERKHHGSS